MADHLKNVQEYDKDADPEVVEKLVTHLGIAARDNDASKVAASDPSELDRIKTGFCKKVLELDDDEAERAVNATAEQMKGDRNKSRVAFYYLVAKHADKLDRIG